MVWGSFARIQTVYIPQSRQDRLLQRLLPCRLDSLCEVVLSLDSALEPLASVRFHPADSLKALRLLLLRNEDPCAHILEFRPPMYNVGYKTEGRESLSSTLLMGSVNMFQSIAVKKQSDPWKICSPISLLASR